MVRIPSSLTLDYSSAGSSKAGKASSGVAWCSSTMALESAACMHEEREEYLRKHMHIVQDKGRGWAPLEQLKVPSILRPHVQSTLSWGTLTAPFWQGPSKKGPNWLCGCSAAQQNLNLTGNPTHAETRPATLQDWMS